MKNKSSKRICTIFPHIPKCGGTSLKSQLEKTNLNIYFDYDKPPHINKFFEEACERRNWETSLLDFGLFDLVYGHFPIARYNRSSYQYIALLRHPVERAISQFFYWKNDVPERNKLALYRNPIIADIRSGNISFTDFLKMQKLDSFYYNYLGDRQPAEFLLVGFTDNYDQFLVKLSKLLDINLSPDVRLRRTDKEELGMNEIDKAKTILKEDIERYNNFYRHWST